VYSKKEDSLKDGEMDVVWRTVTAADDDIMGTCVSDMQLMHVVP
jgi:hypothetical protein